jgi:hypothetical protein
MERSSGWLSPRTSGNVVDRFPRTGYTPRPGTTPESEAETLATVYAFILRCHEEKKAAETSSGADAAKGEDKDRVE